DGDEGRKRGVDRREVVHHGLCRLLQRDSPRRRLARLGECGPARRHRRAYNCQSEQPPADLAYRHLHVVRAPFEIIPKGIPPCTLAALRPCKLALLQPCTFAVLHPCAPLHPCTLARDAATIRPPPNGLKTPSQGRQA